MEDDFAKNGTLQWLSNKSHMSAQEIAIEYTKHWQRELESRRQLEELGISINRKQREEPPSLKFLPEEVQVCYEQLIKNGSR
jgi:hypothetical protein